MITKTLYLVFLDQIGKPITISIADPVEDMSLATISAAMDNLIANNVLARGLISKVSARYVSRTVEDVGIGL